MAPILLREDEFEQECSVSMANSSNKGMIAGLSVFGIVVAITLFGVAIWCSRRRRSKRAQKAFKAIENELNSE
jgi:flagellar biogenesis protein FliO